MSEFSPFEYDTLKMQEARTEDRFAALDLDWDTNLHTTVDSFERHNLPRFKQELTRTETAFAELNTFNADEMHERIIIQAIQFMHNTGQHPNPDESITDFIDRITNEKM